MNSLFPSIRCPGIYPHAHYLARICDHPKFPDAGSETLIHIPDWNSMEACIVRSTVQIAEGHRDLDEFRLRQSEDNIRNPNDPPRA